MNRKIQVFVTVFVVVFGLSVLMNPALARPSEPLTYDYAVFKYDPYPKGTYTMTIYYRHDSYCTMLIYLIDPTNSEAEVWSIDRYSRSGYLYYTGNIDGVWRLKCYMSGYQPYWTDGALFHTFGITDPEPEQDNLGSDWARHPQNSDIYDKALEIIGGTTSSYSAAQNIYSHVVDNFHHTGPDYSFRKDLDLLDDLDTYGEYRGVCRSDAVILTAYARTLEIPARIIHLMAHWEPNRPICHIPPFDDPHYFAEFYVSYCCQYQWVPVDGDSSYDWFGLTEANQRISYLWPEEQWVGGELWGWWSMSISIVTEIPDEGIIDSGYASASYPDHPYQNDL